MRAHLRLGAPPEGLPQEALAKKPQFSVTARRFLHPYLKEPSY